MDKIKESSGIDKYVGNFRLCYLSDEGIPDENRCPEGDRAILLYDCHDGQKMYQVISFEGTNLDRLVCNFFWAKLSVTLSNVDCKRKRFYDIHGNFIMEPSQPQASSGKILLMDRIEKAFESGRIKSEQETE